MSTITALRTMALKGRRDGKEQLLRRGVDCMTMSPWKSSTEEWFAYLTGFYRACGYPGSSNRRQRARASSRSVTTEQITEPKP